MHQLDAFLKEEVDEVTRVPEPLKERLGRRDDHVRGNADSLQLNYVLPEHPLEICVRIWAPLAHHSDAFIPRNANLRIEEFTIELSPSEVEIDQIRLDAKPDFEIFQRLTQIHADSTHEFHANQCRLSSVELE